jgi:hypothetical protein
VQNTVIEMNTAETAAIETAKLTKAQLLERLEKAESENKALAEKLESEAPKTPSFLSLSKGKSVSLSVLNSQLVRIKGKAGNVKEKAKQLGKLSLLTSVTELTGDQSFLMDERSISPLLKGEVISKDDAELFRAYARLVKAIQVIEKA